MSFVSFKYDFRQYFKISVRCVFMDRCYIFHLSKLMKAASVCKPAMPVLPGVLFEFKKMGELE